MNILVISWYFPPANDVAALRVGKLVQYLHERGHSVWVLTGKRSHPDESLPVPLPTDRIIRAPWFDVDQTLFPWNWRKARRPAVPAKPRTDGRDWPRPIRMLREFYINLVRIPDQQIGWLPFALRAGKRLLGRQPIDVIYASGPPFTTFLAARSLGHRFGIPWVAEYRDGWGRYVYAPKPEWRQAIDTWFETRVSRTAKAIVAVSEPWATYYRDRFKLPAIAVYNGIDPEDLPADSERVPAPSRQLSITYVGSLYKGLRDPTILYDAIGRSGLTPADLQVVYYGPKPADVTPLATKLGVPQFVTIKGRVPHRRSLQIQRESDVLLLLQSGKDPRNVPAKVFEYLAARRPILGLGLDEGIPAQIIRRRNAGIYETDADIIAAQLNRWVAEKKATGLIPDLPASVRAGLSRAEQFRLLSDLLFSLQRPIGKESPSATVPNAATRPATGT
jgi:glycosyltransferase involved in cell wall biosynthesis